MANVSVTISSAGTSRPINLDWQNAAPVAFTVTSSTGGTFAYSLQYTLDDVMMTPAANVTWVNDPTLTAATSASSGVITYTAPIAAVRLNSTTLTATALTLKCNQGSWL